MPIVMYVIPYVAVMPYGLAVGNKSAFYSFQMTFLSYLLSSRRYDDPSVSGYYDVFTIPLPLKVMEDVMNYMYEGISSECKGLLLLWGSKRVKSSEQLLGLARFKEIAAKFL